MFNNFKQIALMLMITQTVISQELPTVEPEAIGLSSKRLERLNTVMAEWTAQQKLPGIVTLIARHGKIAQLEAYGMSDIEAKKAMTKDALFRIASMSKPITTTAVMMLYEEGRFALTDPVSQFIPEFKNPQVVTRDAETDSVILVPARREITIRHLLNHTSGISYGEELAGPYYRQAGMTVGLSPTQGTIAEMIKKLAGLPLLSHPGEEFHYGMSLDVLGYFVAVVSGMPFDEFLRKRIFEPLQMKETYFVLPEAELPRMAQLYKPTLRKKLVKSRIKPDYLLTQTYFSGGAGLVSSAKDYVKFAQMILNKGELNGVRLLSRKTVELMTTNSIGELYIPFRIIGDKFGYGFGIRTERGEYDELESLGIFGWDGAFYTRFWIDPQEELIGIFMSQVDGYWDTNYAARFRNLVYQAIVD